MQILAELTPLDPSPGTRPTIRVASGQDRSITGLNGVPWWPAMLKRPSLGIRLFDGDFSNTVDPGQASLDLHVPALEKLDANIRRYIWAGAGITMYAGDSGQAWPWPVVFKGKVDSFRTVGNTTSLVANVDTEPFETNALYLTYAGTGGIEGGADLKGKPKPWALGNPQNLEPILINNIDSIFQVSAYGAIKAVTTLYERGSAFGASYGDYASYTTLQAATIPAGRWATCLASGLIRLGAPPYGVITADVQGDYLGTTWRRLPGAIIQRVCSAVSISSTKIDSASFTALDAVMSALPGGGNISLYQTEQITVMDLAQMIALSCNAQAGVSLIGTLFATRVSFASPMATLDAQGGAKPGVITSTEVDVSPPYKRMQMGGNRAWRVQTFDEIAFGAELIDRGIYGDTTVYRDGNIASLADGSRWLFVGPTPLSGSAPSDANANWSRMTNSITANVAVGSNTLVNSDWVVDSAGWQQFSYTNQPTPLWLNGRDAAGFGGNPRHVLWTSLRKSSGGTLTGGSYFFGWGSKGFGGGLADLQAYGLQVDPGDRVYIRQRMALTNANVANLRIRWWNADGTVMVGESDGAANIGSSHIGGPSGANGDPANYALVEHDDVAPVGAKFATFGCWSQTIGASTSATMYQTEPMMAKIAADQSVFPPYTPGPSQRGADVTNQNTSLNTTNVGTLPATDVSSTINNGGGVAPDQVNTVAILDNNVTESASSSLIGTLTGNGAWQDAINTNITMAQTGTIIVIANFTQGYSVAAPYQIDFELSIDGTVINTVGGSGVLVLTASLSGSADVATGSRNIKLRWRGQGAGVVLQSAKATVFVRYK